MEEKTEYSTALVPQSALTPTIWQMFLSIDQATYKSRRFGATEGETAVKLIFCLENQLPLSTANTGLYLVNGRLGVMGNVIAAKLRQHPHYDYRIVSLTDIGCIIAILRDGDEIGQTIFDKEDAERANLLKKDNWQAYPQDMYFNRAISRAYKLYAPDLFMSGPVYVADELVAGDAIEGEWSITPPHTEYALGDLVDKFGPEAILNANDGKLPATDEEINAVAEKLEAI